MGGKRFKIIWLVIIFSILSSQERMNDSSFARLMYTAILWQLQIQANDVQEINLFGYSEFFVSSSAEKGLKLCPIDLRNKKIEATSVNKGMTYTYQ